MARDDETNIVQVTSTRASSFPGRFSPVTENYKNNVFEFGFASWITFFHIINDLIISSRTQHCIKDSKCTGLSEKVGAS